MTEIVGCSFKSWENCWENILTKSTVTTTTTRMFVSKTWTRHRNRWKTTETPENQLSSNIYDALQTLLNNTRVPRHLPNWEPLESGRESLWAADSAVRVAIGPFSPHSTSWGDTRKACSVCQTQKAVVCVEWFSLAASLSREPSHPR